MTIIVCQDCDEVIEFTDADKVDVLYGKCSECRSQTMTVNRAEL